MVRDPIRRLTAAAALALAQAALAGCYYVHLASGQLEMNRRREPIETVLARPGTAEPTRRKLGYAGRARDFAMGALGLPDNGSYRSYADLGRPWATWNLFAAPEFSVTPRRWCFPVAGCVAYRGYFDLPRARRAAARQVRRGNDVYLGASIAYSTLGHLRDPILNTMLARDDAELAALIFHELAHQAVYAPDDSDFSEAFASVVEAEGVRRWLLHEGRSAELAAFQAGRAREEQIAARMIESRQWLGALFARDLPAGAMREEKAAELSRLREALAALGLADAGELNNARLAAVATYHHCLAPIAAALARLDGELPAFYAEMRRIARDPAARGALCGG